MKIRDLVSVDAKAEFRSDVQISDFEDPEVNLALLHSYIFSRTAPSEQESTVGVLRIATDAFSSGRLENRIAIVANYGHGKSHLALVLANYFSKPYPSPELKIIIEKLANAINNDAQAAHYREFRKNHAEHLVIRLRGDVPHTLREQFVASLEQALGEHQATKDAKVPHWFEGAEKFLLGLKGDELARANRYLDKVGTEVKLLLADVRKRRPAAYDHVRDLSRELYGFPLEFGAQVSMATLLKWAVDTYCGEGKPLGGVLVLFDEFSLYVMNYAQRNAAGELQDLLNGIEKHRGKALFMALAQHDPAGLARQLAVTEQRETLEKELTRIPRRVRLYSLMESVVDAYLKQPDAAWRELRSQKNLRGPLARASSIAMDMFSRRYERTLNWGPEEFDRVVTQGCFPLHPITTALLCDMQLQAVQVAGNPRTVLGFVLEQVSQKQNQPAAEGNRLNWVLPIALVDYFREYLSRDALRLYSETLRHLPGDADPQQAALLKALLLQTAAGLPGRRDTQIEFLAEASGLEPDAAKKQLRAMSGESRILQWDPNTSLYSFWPVGANPHGLDDILQTHLSQASLTWELLGEVEEQLTGIAVDVPWGHPEDWRAGEYVLSRAFFDVPHVRELIEPFKVKAAGEVDDDDRGCVIWLLAQAEEDVDWFRRKATDILDEAFPGENPPPVILMQPERPAPGLVDALKRVWALRQFTQDERKEVGDAFEQELRRQKQAIENGLVVLRGEGENYASMPRPVATWVALAPYRAGLQARGRQGLQKLLANCYELAYRFSPPEFFTQYRRGGKGPSPLRNAVRMLSAVLLRNNLPSSYSGISVNAVVRDTSEKFLRDKWRIVTADWRLQEPGNQRLEKAWKLLNETFGAGRQDVPLPPVVAKLLNPPYGYDLNTLSLLFSAWIGYNVQDLQVSLGGRQAAWEKVAEALTDTKAQLVTTLLEQQARISRRDQAVAVREVKETIRKAKRGTHTQAEAHRMLANLQAYLADSGPSAPSASEAQQAAEHLQQALNEAKDYDKLAGEISSQIRQEKNANALITTGNRIKNLPKLGNVLPAESGADELQTRWLTSLEVQVEEACSSLEAIEGLPQLELNKRELEDLKKRLRSAGLADLAKRVDKSARALERRGQELQREGQEEAIRAQIGAMTTRVGLADLLAHQAKLKTFSDLSASTGKIREKKSDEIRRAIDQSETFAKGLLEAVGDLKDREGADSWLTNFHRAHQQYQETPLYAKLAEASDRAMQVRQYYADLEPLSQRRPATPEELEAVKLQLETLSEMAKSLGAATRVAHKKAEQQLDQHAEKLQDQTTQWLDSFEYGLKDAPTMRWLHDRLQSPPAYMTAANQKRWEKLRRQAQTQIDQDVVSHIEGKFREIRDPDVRQACLRRLQEIAKEKAAR
ncbi:MAG: hypothetical protein IT318_06315 [Anaerolineales bacterium]|nr:hypothetical protein [Anaerolineales bacterium]